MKKFIINSTIALFIFLLLTLSAFAARFRDDMDRLDSSPTITYQNLTLSQKTGAGNDTLFKIKDPMAGSGSIVYRINNASTVSAVIYSAMGTQLYNDEDKNFFLADSFSHSALTIAGFPTFFSPSDNGLYILPGGSPQKLVYRYTYGYYFSPVAVLPNDLMNYTVNISVSADGKRYSSLSILRASSEILEAIGLVKEEWSAVIPTGVTYLKVELNDFTQIFTHPQGVYEPRGVEELAMVAYVDIEGDGLIIAVPQPVEVSTGSATSSTTSKEKKESSKTSSKPASSSKTSSLYSSLPTAASTLPSTTFPKFEGIVFPEKSTSYSSLLSASSKFEGAPSSKVTTVKSAKQEVSLSPNESEDDKTSTFFFAADESASSKNSSIFISAYVILLTVGIFIALKNRSKGGK